MSSTIRYALGLPVWAGLIYGTLQLHDKDLGLGHGICGPWGCGPPIEALIGFHGFSLLLVLPIALLLGLYLSSDSRKKLGSVLLWGALAALLVYMIQDGVVFFRRAKSAEHLIQRALFSVAIEVDLPMLQVAIAGFCLRFWPIRNESVAEMETVANGQPQVT